jgi:hypothetical protein
MHSSTTLRGWRKAGVVAGSLAVLATGAATTAQAFADPGPGTPQAGPSPAHDDKSTKDPKSTATSGLASTGRAHTAALYGAVTELVPGQGAQFQGQGGLPDLDSPGTGWLGVTGSLDFTPADGSGMGNVHVGVMAKSMFRNEPASCVGGSEACTITERPDGSELLTDSYDLGGGEKRNVVEYYAGDIRVTVWSTNGGFTAGETFEATRPDPLLSIDQLTTIAMKPWWSLGSTLDAPYADDLPSYHEAPSGL